MNWKLKLATFLLFLVASQIVFAQAKVLRQPVIWENVRFKSESRDWGYFSSRLSEAQKEYWKFKHNKSNKNYWRVICSTEGACAFPSPNGKEGSNCQNKLKFNKTYWVLAENGDYVNLSDDNLNPNSIGWVHKQDLILWHNPLRDDKTGIELKAFLINEGYDPNVNRLLDTKDTYQVYDSPTSTKSIETRYIYDVLFIFKYDDSMNENGRFLVSKYYNSGASKDLLGWVDANKIKVWKTSLCLEPNFDKEALIERDTLGINSILFQQGQNKSLEDYRTTGDGNGITKNELRDPSNGKWQERPRMNGQMMRYPVFGGVMEGTENCMYLTGVSGRNTLANNNVVEGLDDDYYQKLKKITKNLEKLTKNVNILFVVDGTENMLRYSRKLQEAIKQLNATYQSDNLFQYGAVAYRNTNLQDPDLEELCAIKPLTNDGIEVAEWLKGLELFDGNLTNKYEAVRYGINKALELLPENETNIIFHVGNASDLSENGFVKSPGITLGVNETYAPLFGTRLDVHYIGFTTYSDQIAEPDRRKCFEHMRNKQMKDISNFMNSKYKGKGTNYLRDLVQPAAPKPETISEPGRMLTFMEGSNFNIRAYWLKDDYMMDYFYDEIFKNVKVCMDRQKETLTMLKDLTEDNSKLKDQVEDFNPGVVENVLYSTLNELDSLERQNIIEGLSKQKIHLFLDANTFYTLDKIENPLFKYVLFMHQERLNQEIKSISSLRDALASSDNAVIRDLLAQHWARKAENILGAGDYSGLSMEDLMERLQGIEGMDVMPLNTTSIYGNLKFGDVVKKKRLTNDQLIQLREEIVKDSERLNKLRSSEYAYQIDGSDDVFYWVPVEFLFH